MIDYELIRGLKEKINKFYQEEWKPLHKTVCEYQNELFNISNKKSDLEKEILEIKKNMESKINFLWKKKHKNPENEIKNLEERINELKNKLKITLEEKKPCLNSYLKINDEYQRMNNEYYSLINSANKERENL